MNLVNQIAAFVVDRWAILMAAAYVLLDVTVAVTPKRYQTKPVFGLMLRAFHWVSLHTHFDEFGSLKIPALNIPLQIGALKVSVVNADTTAKIPPG